MQSGEEEQKALNEIKEASESLAQQIGTILGAFNISYRGQYRSEIALNSLFSVLANIMYAMDFNDEELYKYLCKFTESYIKFRDERDKLLNQSNPHD